MTNAQHAAEHIRDVPQSCICIWQWDALYGRYTLRYPAFGCPWHLGGKLWLA